jgi:hypothetical protein
MARQPSRHVRATCGAERALALAAAESVLFTPTVGRSTLITVLQFTRNPILSGTVAVRMVSAGLCRLDEASAGQHIGALRLPVASVSVPCQSPEHSFCSCQLQPSPA